MGSLLLPIAAGHAQASPAVKGVTCSANTLVPPADISCSITLTEPAPSGGLVVQLASSSSALTVPASVIIEPGTSTAVFNATGSEVGSTENAAVTAMVGGMQANSAVSLASSSSEILAVAKNSGKCLDVRGSSTSAGAVVQQSSCTGGQNQKWFATPTGDGSYELQSASSGMALDVSGNSPTNGAAIIQSPYAGASGEKWHVAPTGSGYYSLTAESSGKCLDVTGGTSATGDGVPIQQWACTGADNQAWQLTLNHSVSLNWNASTSSGISGYYVYRSTQANGSYTRLSSVLTGTSYTDASVTAGQTYYYSTTAVGANNQESAYSNQVKAAVPTP